MKEIIRKIYKNYLVEQVDQYNFNEYYYFIDNDNNIFGLAKNNITGNELKLISSNFHQLHQDEILDDKFQLLDYLFGRNTNQQKYTNLKYYLIKLFKVVDEEVDTEIYNLLKSTFFDAYVTRRNNIFIILIEQEQDIQFGDFLQSIETDFLIKLIGYESDYYENNSLLPHFFQLVFSNLKNYHKANRLLVKKAHLLTNQLLTNIDNESRKIIKQYIFKEFLFDQDMKKIIKMYFETNFNSSLAAKKCYMHRNTFLNKLDKFSSITNFNLKNYDEAFIIYLALIM